MAETLLTYFRRNALKFGNLPCFHFKKNNAWQKQSWVEAEDLVRRYTLGLSALGIKPGDKVAMLSATRVEWTLLDLSILANRAVTVPLYPTLSPEQIAYILKDSKCTLLIVENRGTWDRIAGSLPGWKFPALLIEGKEEGFLSLDALLDRGKSTPVNQYDDNLREIQPSDTATIVYTSGTTGPPKGAILTHRSLMAETEGLQDVFPFGIDSIGLMCLPLAHVIARAMQYYQLVQGTQAAYAQSLELLPFNLKEVRPHYMAGVPRLFEKSYEKITHRLQEVSWWKKKLFRWTLNVGYKVSFRRQKKIAIPFSLLLLNFFAYLLVFRKIRKGFGGRIQFLISGGAPLSKSIARFFHAVGILIIEGYGLTETFAAVTLNRLDDYRFGTVGKPLAGMRVKINEEGEICVKGDNLFSGYLGKREETETSFDGEGWYLTGDIGEYTKDGFLRITDRKKDIIVTSGGKNIAPQNIEHLIQQSPYIQQIMVHGEGRKFLSALVTLNWDTIRAYAKQEKLEETETSALANHPKINALIQGEIDGFNKHLSRFETIKKFAILDSNFSVETGELTPTMKVKRKWVTDKYRSILDQFYIE